MGRRKEREGDISEEDMGSRKERDWRIGGELQSSIA
jgi:hypothetical protein